MHNVECDQVDFERRVTVPKTHMLAVRANEDLGRTNKVIVAAAIEAALGRVHLADSQDKKVIPRLDKATQPHVELVVVQHAALAADVSREAILLGGHAADRQVGLGHHDANQQQELACLNVQPTHGTVELQLQKTHGVAEAQHFVLGVLLG